MKTIIQNVDLVHLKMIASANNHSAKKILDLFKEIGDGIHRMISRDFNIYHYAFELATEFSDEEFISFLEEYSNLFVQLRIGAMTIAEMEKLYGKEKPAYNHILKFSSEVPKDSLHMTLLLMTEKGWLTKEEAENIAKYFADLLDKT